MTVPTIAEVLYSFQLGGSERLAALLARQFRERGYRVIAASMYDAVGPVRDEIADSGIPTYGYDYTHRSRWKRWLMPGELTRMFHDQNVVAAHLHHGLAAIRAARAARRAGVPRIVMTEHSAQPLRDLAWYKKATLKAMTHLDAVTTVNEDIEQFFVTDMAMDPARVTTVPNAVDPRLLELRRDPALRAAAGVGDAFVFAFLGRLHPDKDVGTLLRAFAKVVAAGGNVKLIVAGDGEERAKLEALARELALGDHVRFWGATRDVLKLFGIADAFVMSSIAEGLPMALLEAMSAGLPCISTAVGGIPDVLKDGTGLLAPASDDAALAEAMISVARDPALAARLGEAGRSTIHARFSVDAVVDRYLDLFHLPRRWPTSG